MDLYKNYEALSPIYQGGLTNHLPMVLVALKELGVEDEIIIQKLDNYREEKGVFDLTDNNVPIDSFDQAYINLTGSYMAAINRSSADVVIGEVLNKHRDDISSGLFHGLIRLAYAKKSNLPLMIAQALAYFEITSEKLDIQPTYISEDKFENAYHVVFEAFKHQHKEFKTNGTSNRLQEVLQSEPVKGNLLYLKNPNREYILDFILSNYIRTQDFYILHLVTGFEALLELEQYLFNFDDVLNHFFAVSQAFILFNTTINVDESLRKKSLEELSKEVVNLDDFHDIKLFFSLLQLEKLYRNKKIAKIANLIFNK